MCHFPCLGGGKDGSRVPSMVVWLWREQSGVCSRGTVLSEKTVESPLDYKEIQPVHPKGDQSWMVMVRTDVEGETPILWPPDEKI